MAAYALLEDRPAAAFWDAHYLGNGRLGLSVMGQAPLETIYINEDTLWSGSERFVRRPEFYDALMRARACALEGRSKEANRIINDEMAGRWQETYLPLARLHLMAGMPDNTRNMPLKRIIESRSAEITGYERKLDLSTAVESVRWTLSGVRHLREQLVSHPSDCAWIRFSAQAEGCAKPLCFAMDLVSDLHARAFVSGGTYLISGLAPDHCEPSYTPVTPSAFYGEESQSNALRFACAARVTETDGTVDTDGCRVYVRDASYAVICLNARTNYAGFRQARDPDLCHLEERVLSEVGNTDRTYAQALAEHLEDYRALYDRVDIELGEPLTDALPTSRRMQACAGGADDPALYALYLQYVRYLTIAGSRPGSQPLNLQGIWNQKVDPPWSSNYTTNINVEMNYWPCETLALSECHLPLMDMIRELSAAGEETAREYYHMRGWTAHHNVDLWRGSEPACEDATWSWWPYGGAWLCEHVWTHYQYTGDLEFLRSFYPIMKSQAEFFLDFLTEGPDGTLVTAPSISPENKYLMGTRSDMKDLVMEMASGSRCSSNDPRISAVTVAGTMDMSILRELFSNVIRANAALGGGDTETAEALHAALRRFPPYRTGRYGQLLEWDRDYEECAPGMSHLSHMYPVYPAGLITEKTPELLEAARRSLDVRLLHNSKEGGWPAAWRICLEARFGNGLECGHLIKSIGEGFGCGLLTRNSQQIDAIFGLGAGIAEMLLQSHDGVIRLLPAVPTTWYEGRFRGFRARGGFTVSAAWADSHLKEGTLEAASGGSCRVIADGLVQVTESDTGKTVWQTGNGESEARFDVEAGKTYILHFRSAPPAAYPLMPETV